MSALRRSKRRSRDSAIASGCSGSRRSASSACSKQVDRLAVGRAQEGLGAGLAQVAHRLVPDLALPRVVRQPLHVLDEAIGVQALDGGHHRGVQGAPALPQQARVGHVVGERVLEGEFQIREELRLVEELRLLQMGQPPPQGLLRLLRDRRQQRVGHVLADHRRRPAGAASPPAAAGRCAPPGSSAPSPAPAAPPPAASAGTLRAPRPAPPSPPGSAPSPPGRTGCPASPASASAAPARGPAPSSAASSSAALSAGRVSSRSWE